MAAVFRFLIENDNPRIIQQLLDTGIFVTQDNVDELITLSIANTQNGGSPESHLLLTRYKAEHFGFIDPEESFKL